MKIISRRDTTRQWWIGMRITCECGTTVEVEDGDEVRLSHFADIEHADAFFIIEHTDAFLIDCPDCGRGLVGYREDAD